MNQPPLAKKRRMVQVDQSKQFSSTRSSFVTTPKSFAFLPFKNSKINSSLVFPQPIRLETRTPSEVARMFIEDFDISGLDRLKNLKGFTRPNLDSRYYRLEKLGKICKEGEY
jgi:hypothetical protein